MTWSIDQADSSQGAGLRRENEEKPAEASGGGEGGGHRGQDQSEKGGDYSRHCGDVHLGCGAMVCLEVKCSKLWCLQDAGITQDLL